MGKNCVSYFSPMYSHGQWKFADAINLAISAEKDEDRVRIRCLN